MDTNKIIALIKLANNNPNENEANLAARKVCKVLAELNFPINGKITDKPITPPTSKIYKCKTCNYPINESHYYFFGGICARCIFEKSQEQKKQQKQRVYCSGGCNNWMEVGAGVEAEYWCGQCNLKKDEWERESYNRVNPKGFDCFCIKCRQNFKLDAYDYILEKKSRNICSDCKEKT